MNRWTWHCTPTMRSAREHLVLRREPATGQFFAIDKSTNGTWLEGKRMKRDFEHAVPEKASIGVAEVLDFIVPGAEMTVAPGAATDPGRISPVNEDRVHVDSERGVYLVVDGLGGHAAGDRAAEIAVEVIARELDPGSVEPAEGYAGQSPSPITRFFGSQKRIRTARVWAACLPLRDKGRRDYVRPCRRLTVVPDLERQRPEVDVGSLTGGRAGGSRRDDGTAGDDSSPA